MSAVPTSTPRHAIVSLRIPREKWVDATEESVKAYGQRHGLEVIALREERVDLTVLRWRRRNRNLHLEKFQIFDMLADYDRLIYVDADVLIHPDAPNLLDHVPTAELGAVNEQVGPEAVKRQQEWAAMERRLGPLAHTPERYFNAGVMAFSRAHRDLFSYRGRAFAAGRWPDQNTLNYYAFQAGVPLCWLDESWNTMPAFGPRFHESAQRRQSWFIHYAGTEAKSVLLSDLEYFYGREAALRVVS